MNSRILARPHIETPGDFHSHTRVLRPSSVLKHLSSQLKEPQGISDKLVMGRRARRLVWTRLEAFGASDRGSNPLVPVFIGGTA